MSFDEKMTASELADKIRAAQEIQITNGPIVGVMEGRVSVVDALREGAYAVDAPGHRVNREHRDAGEYDAVLRWHCRL